MGFDRAIYGFPILSLSELIYPCLFCYCLTVHLVHGTTPYRGLLETYVLNDWRQVLIKPDHLAEEAADYICKTLHYDSVSEIHYHDRSLNEGATPFKVDNVDCSYTDNVMFDCSYTMHTGSEPLAALGLVCRPGEYGLDLPWLRLDLPWPEVIYIGSVIFKWTLFIHNTYYTGARTIVWFELIIQKLKFQTKHNKASHNRTASATHANVPRFPGACGLLASDERDWIHHVQLTQVFCLCQVVDMHWLHADYHVLSEIYFFE